MRTTSFNVFILCLVVFAYAAAGAGIMARYPQEREKGLRLRLDRFRPSFDYLVNLSDARETAKPRELQRYLSYYDYIIQIKEADDSVQEIRAFCYFYLGKTQEAFVLYGQALSADTRFFWTPYNMAMAQLAQGRLSEAKTYLIAALKTDRDASMRHMLQARAYLQFMVANQMAPAQLAARLAQGYAQAILCLKQIAMLETMPAGPAANDMHQDLMGKARVVLF